MRAIAASLVIALWPALGQAEEFKRKVPKQFCAPAEAILSSIHSCEENDVFLEQGEACLSRLDEESKAVTGSVIGAFSANSDQRQTGKMTSANQDFLASSAGFAYLIGTTELALAQLAEYKDSLQYPEDWWEEHANMGDVAGYIKGVDCYGTNLENLESLEQDFQRRLGELKKAKQVADSYALKTQDRRAKLDAGPAAPVKELRGVGQGAVRLPASANTPKKASTITGVEVERDKRAKAPLKTRAK